MKLNPTSVLAFVSALAFQAPAFADKSNAAVIETEQQSQAAYVPGEVLIKFKKGTNEIQKAIVRKSVTSLREHRRFKSLSSGNVELLKFDSKQSVDDMVKQLSQNPHVEIAERNGYLHAVNMPNDSEFDQLWGLHNTGQNNGLDDADIDAPEAWQVSKGSKDVVVAVLDTGIDYNHSDLVDNMWVNPNEIPGNGVDDDGNGYIDDVHGWDVFSESGDIMDDNNHGTHVAGTVGAKGNNGQGIVGVNWDVSLMGCKMLDSGGGGSWDGAVRCIDYIVAHRQAGTNVRIINASWGAAAAGSDILEAAIEELADSEVLFVAAAGNDAANTDNVSFIPSGFEADNIISVASTDRNDALSGFSNYAAVSVDLAAPGSAIYSTVPGNGYSSFSGTSMAAPHVAGAAALLLSVAPDLTTAELKKALMDSGDSLSALDGKTASGKRLNIANAIEYSSIPTFLLELESESSQLISRGEAASFNIAITKAIADFNDEIELSIDTDSSLSASLSANTVKVGDEVTLLVETDDNSDTGTFSFDLNATSGDISRSITVVVRVLPDGVGNVSFVNDNALDIPDNDSTSSTLNVPDRFQIISMSVSVDITHTWRGDLRLTLVSPLGTRYTFKEVDGGDAADNVVATFDLDAYNDEIAYGDWTLEITDAARLDTGTLNSWSLNFFANYDYEPFAPEADFTYDVSFGTATFTDKSTDYDRNIVSWLWDFGDGTTSTEQNPAYAYSATADYDVVLTVTDADGLSSTVSKPIFVEVRELVFDAAFERASRSRFGTVTLIVEWTGYEEATDVELYINGKKHETLPNRGQYVYRERAATTSDYTVFVCAKGTLKCSEDLKVSF